jgi:hypothetical protein
MGKQPGTRLRRRYQGILGLWLTLTALPAASQVGPLTYQNLFFDQAMSARSANNLAVQAGLVYTDNATQTTGGSGEALGEVGLVGNAAQEGSRFDYRINSDLSAVKYFGGTYPVEPLGYLNALGELKLVPGLFTWIGRETYTQLLINPLAPATPDNLENLNYVTTGPRFTFRPTLRTAVTLDLLYSYVDSHSPSPLYVNIDNHRYGENLKIERAFSSVASLYLKESYQKVDFTDTELNNDFTLAQGTAGYKLEAARTVLDVSAGYTQLRQLDVPVTVQSVIGSIEHQQTDTYNAPAWRLNLSRLITPNQRLSLIASQQLVDFATGTQLDFDQVVPTFVAPEVAVGAPFTQRTFGVDWRLQASRTTLDVALQDLSQHYRLTLSNERDLVTPSQNYNVKQAGVVVMRQISPVLNWDIGLHFLHQDQENARGASSTSGLTDLRWQAGRRITLRFLFAHSQYLGIRDNQVGLLASYALISGGQLGGIELGGSSGETQPAPGISPIAPTSMLPQP